jgi:hypothetical protein
MNESNMQKNRNKNLFKYLVKLNKINKLKMNVFLEKMRNFDEIRG